MTTEVLEFKFTRRQLLGARAGVTHGAIAEQLAGLLALAVGPDKPRVTKHRHRMLCATLRSLEDRAEDIALSPADVAHAQGISKRYLHAMFASAGTTFCAELRRIRLERAARLMRDDRFDRISVADIAWRCGFADSSHFARCFRAQYGMAPRAFRDEARTGA